MEDATPTMSRAWYKKIYPWLLLLLIVGLGLASLYWYFLRVKVAPLISGDKPVIRVASEHPSFQWFRLTDENRLLWQQFLNNIRFDELEAIFQLDSTNQLEEIEIVRPLKTIYITVVDKVVRGIQTPSRENPEVVEHAIQAGFNADTQTLTLRIFINPQLIPGNELMTTPPGEIIQEEIIKQRYLNHIVAFNLVALAAQRITDSKGSYDAFITDRVDLINSKFNQGKLLITLQ